MSAITRWPLSVRARLTLWYSAALAVLLIAFAAASHAVLGRTLLRRVDHFLDEGLSAFSAELAVEVREMGSPIAAITAALADIRFRDMRIVVLDTAGAFVATGQHDGVSPAPAHRLDMRVLSASVRPFHWNDRPAFTLGTGESGYRVHVMPDSAQGVHIRVAGAYPLRDISATMLDVGRAYLVAIPLFVALAALGGFFLARRSLAPVAAMGSRAAEISATTLHERLPVANPGDELGRLATTINELLDRLDQAFQQQRRFMADASHELRTPVTILKTEAQVTLAKANRTEDEYRASAGVMADVAQRLARIVDDLFLLARADAGHLTPRYAPVYLDEIVHSIVRSVQTIADQRSVHVQLTQLAEAPVTGDPDLLGRILLNLLDNAIRHSPRDGTVEVALSQKDGSYVISVSDMGPGVPDEARERIFERFFRVDTVRSRSDASKTGGAGLGLAIARWAAEAHGGRIDLAEHRNGRTTFHLTVPANHS